MDTIIFQSDQPTVISNEDFPYVPTEAPTPTIVESTPTPIPTPIPTDAISSTSGTSTGGVVLSVMAPPQMRIQNVGSLISSGFSLLLIIAGLIAFAYILMGGIQWITSGGDKGGLEAARNKIIHAIVGLVVVASSWAIVLLLQNYLGTAILGEIPIPRAYN